MGYPAAQTMELEAKQLDLFCRWCSGFFEQIDLTNLFSLCPLFLCQALVRDADVMYTTGGALSNLRHLILAAQRWVPACRPMMQPAWEMVERWESLVPVRHRTPIPEALVQSLCVLAWQLKWFSWVGATLLAFYGAGRLGEILKCCREDLVLPGDVLEPPGSPVFLRLRNFKSRMRQPAKVQHMKVENRVARSLLVKIFRRLEYDAPCLDLHPVPVQETLGFPTRKAQGQKPCYCDSGCTQRRRSRVPLQAGQTNTRSSLADASQKPNHI